MRRRHLPPRRHGRNRPAAAAAALLLLAVAACSTHGLRLSPPHRGASSRGPISHRRPAPRGGDGLRYADYRLDGAEDDVLFQPGPDRGIVTGVAPLGSLGPKWRRRRRGGKGKDEERSTMLRRLVGRVSNTWWIVRETIRTRLERCTVYVLECEGDKYYV